jgi:hypothetical protein
MGHSHRGLIDTVLVSENVVVERYSVSTHFKDCQSTHEKICREPASSGEGSWELDEA